MCLTGETGPEFDYAKSPGRCKRHAARHSERRTGFLGPPVHGARAAGAFSTCYAAAVIPLGERRPLVRALSADEIAGLHRAADGYVERLGLYRSAGVR